MDLNVSKQEWSSHMNSDFILITGVWQSLTKHSTTCSASSMLMVMGSSLTRIFLSQLAAKYIQQKDCISDKTSPLTLWSEAVAKLNVGKPHNRMLSIVLCIRKCIKMKLLSFLCIFVNALDLSGIGLLLTWSRKHRPKTLLFYRSKNLCHLSLSFLSNCPNMIFKI